MVRIKDIIVLKMRYLERLFRFTLETAVISDLVSTLQLLQLTAKVPNFKQFSIALFESEPLSKEQSGSIDHTLLAKL